jgi:hypothetical protein
VLQPGAHLDGADDAGYPPADRNCDIGAAVVDGSDPHHRTDSHRCAQRARLGGDVGRGNHGRGPYGRPNTVTAPAAATRHDDDDTVDDDTADDNTADDNTDDDDSANHDTADDDAIAVTPTADDD